MTKPNDISAVELAAARILQGLIKNPDRPIPADLKLVGVHVAALCINEETGQITVKSGMSIPELLAPFRHEFERAVAEEALYNDSGETVERMKIPSEKVKGN